MGGLPTLLVVIRFIWAAALFQMGSYMLRLNQCFWLRKLSRGGMVSIQGCHHTELIDDKALMIGLEGRDYWKALP